ncbi:hypothetical protein ENUP19_0364G0065 [Entamoeba nuttalli]|uniref:Uncharacterized protein n=1 Tax=Entamoeba nuttalli TaxID=412467 RepID=A0ABQ0DYU0_9EUKA
MIFYPTLEEQPPCLNPLIKKINNIPFYLNYPIIIIPHKITLSPVLPKHTGIVKIKTFTEVLSSFNYAFYWALTTIKPFPLITSSSLSKFLYSLKPQLPTLYSDSIPNDPSSYISSYNAFIETIIFFITDESTIQLFEIEPWFINEKKYPLMSNIINNKLHYISSIQLALKKYLLPASNWPINIQPSHIIEYANKLCDPTLLLKQEEFSFIVPQMKRNAFLNSLNEQSTIDDLMKTIINFVYKCAYSFINDISIIIPSVPIDNESDSASTLNQIEYESITHQSLLEKESTKPKFNSINDQIKFNKKNWLREGLKRLESISPQSLKNLVLQRELDYWKETVELLKQELKQLEIN